MALDPDVLKAARARRAAGQGWQTIANVLRVNRVDLQSACGAIGVEQVGARRPPPPTPAVSRASASPAAIVPVESRAPDLRPLGRASAGLEVLGLLCDARLDMNGLAAATGLEPHSLRPCIGRLLGKRLIAPVGGRGDYGATPWGVQVRAASLDAAIPGPRRSNVLDRILVLMAEGIEDSPTVAARLGIDIPAASARMGRLRDLGLARSSPNPAAAGRGAQRRFIWRLTPAGAAWAAELISPQTGAPTHAPS